MPHTSLIGASTSQSIALASRAVFLFIALGVPPCLLLVLAGAYLGKDEKITAWASTPSTAPPLLFLPASRAPRSWPRLRLVQPVVPSSPPTPTAGSSSSRTCMPPRLPTSRWLVPTAPPPTL